MIATMVTLPLFSLLIYVASAFALVANHNETLHREERNYRGRLEELQRVIDDQVGTIEAYRELVSTDASFSLISPSEALIEAAHATRSGHDRISA